MIFSATPRSSDAIAVLEALASSGSAGSVSLGIHIDQSEPGLEELEEKGFLSKMVLLGQTAGHSNFTLTDKGRTCMRPCLRLHRPVCLPAYHREVSDFEDYTCLELITRLASSGWQDKESNPSKKIMPYDLKQQQVWYRQPKKKISKLYLHALIVAKDRISAGLLQSVHHFQSQAYYRCVIDKVPNPLPDQPLSYYKILCSGRGGPVQTADQEEEQPVPECAEDDMHLLPEMGSFG